MLFRGFSDPLPPSHSSGLFGAKGQGVEICAASESFLKRIAFFAWIAKP